MRKNVLFSLIAASSASMVAYADADLSNQIKNDQVSDWTDATEGFTFTDRIIASPGVAIEQTIGNLVKGEYKLTATTLENAKLTVNGKDLPEDGKFTLDSETEVTIGAVSLDGNGFKVGGFELLLVYDFKSCADKLTFKLSEVINKINDGDEAGRQLAAEASEIGAEIGKIKDGGEESYDIYVAYQLYIDNIDETVIGKKIAELNNKVENATGNLTAYNNALDAIKELKERRGQEKKGFFEVTDEYNSSCDYTKTKYKEALDAIASEITAFETAAKEAYDNFEAATVCSEDKIYDFKLNVSSELKSLSNNIKDSNADDAAYNAVATLIDAAKATYDDKLQKVIAALPGEPDVYGEMLKLVQAELNEQYMIIVAAQEANGNKDAHDNAAEKQEENTANITKAQGEIVAVAEKYLNKAAQLKADYQTAINDIAALKTSLGEVVVEGVEEKYKETIDEINALIDAFEAKINEANKNNTDEEKNISNFIASAEYSNSKAEIEKAISDFKTAAAPDVANYKANVETTNAINNIKEALTDAIAKVNGLASEDGAYKVSGKYATKEKTLNDKITAFATKAEEAYKANNAVSFKEENIASINGMSSEISDYTSIAETVLEKYETITATLKVYDEKLEELRTKVTNTSVTVYAENGKTYGDRINELASDIKSIKDACDAAVKLSGDEHATAMLAINTENTIVSEIETLISSYDADQEKYDENVTKDAAEFMLKQVLTTTASYTDMLKGYEALWTGEKLGSAYEEIIGELDALKLRVDAESKRAESADVVNRPTEAIALLSEVKTALNEIGSDLEKLQAKAQTALDKISENKEYKKTADDKIKELKTYINGNSADITAFLDICNDPMHADDLQAFKTNTEAEITNYESEIQTAYDEENLKAEWEDSKNADEELVEGIASRIENLLNAIMKKRELATKLQKNYESFNELNKYVTDKKVQEAINQARNDVNDNAGAEANAHYIEVVDGYQTKLDDIKTQITDDRKDTISVQNNKAVKNSIDNLLSNAKAVKSLVLANEAKHKEQTAKFDAVQAEWTRVYYKLSTSDQSSQLEEYLSQLADEQTKLNTIKTNIADFYAKGMSDSKNAETIASLDAINSIILSIEKTQSDNYVDEIAKDNLARYTTFLNTIATTEKDYKDAVAMIDKFSNIQNEDYDAALEDILKAYEGIYEYASKISKLRTDAETAYKAVEGAELYDVDELNTATAVTYSAEINAKLTEFTDKVNAQAKAVFENALNGPSGAQTLLNQAIAQLNGYDSKVIADAFKDVRELIADAKAVQNDIDFAVKLDGILTSFASVQAMLSEGYEPAALAEWNVIIAEPYKTYQSNLENLKGFVYSTDNTRDYLGEYEEMAARTILIAIQIKDETVKDGCLFDNIDMIKSLLEEFNNSTIYSDAENASINNPENVAAYNELTALISTVQSEFDKVKEYVDGYYYVDNTEFGVNESINIIQDELNSIESDIKKYYNSGECTNKKEETKERCNRISQNIIFIYSKANRVESKKLNAEINVLKGEYNKAAAAVLGTDAQAELAKYEKTIEDLTNELAKVDEKLATDYYQTEIQASYVALEKKFATTRTELVAFYDGTLVANTLAEFNNKVSVLNSEYSETYNLLNACDQVVKDEYTSSLEEVNSEIDAIRAAIDTYHSENTLLTYADKLNAYIENTSAQLSSVKESIVEMQKPITDNREAYARLTKELEDLNNRLNSVIEVISGYQYVDINNYQYYIDLVNILIEDDEMYVGNLYTEGKLTPESELLYKDDVNNYILYSIESLAAKSEINGKLTAIGTRLTNSHKSFTNPEEGIAFTADDKNILLDQHSKISDAKTKADKYHEDGFKGKLEDDINGTKYEDGPITIDRTQYMSIIVPEVNEKIDELNQQIDELNTSIKNNAYILGDVNRDSKVRVDDYEEILEVSLGKKQIEEGTKEFLAADCNEDGAINVGDVTKVALIINDPGLSYNKAKTRTRVSAVKPTSVSDVLSISAETQGATQRIAINLANSMAYAGCQMDIKLPAGMILVSESLSSRASSHNLYSNDLSNGVHRVIISSLSCENFTDAENAILYLEVSGNANVSGIEVENVLFSDNKGLVYSVEGVGGGTTGIDGVTNGQSLKSKIYNVGGQLLDTVKKGINIIRNSDGTTKKILKK